MIQRSSAAPAAAPRKGQFESVPEAGTPATAQASRRKPRHGRFAELFSNEKNFKHRWVGSRRGNRLGLHVARVLLASLCAGVRRSLAPGREADLAAVMQRDGVLVLENALPGGLFERAREEFARALSAHEARVPRPPCNTRGFGAPLPNAWGFDRYDGGSLNRFMEIGPESPALREAFADDGALAARLRPLVGTRVALDRFMLYLLVHGDENERPDLQRKVHCDTFHETFKLWYFLDEVKLEHGPLMFARGSHRNTPARLAWERRCILDGRSGSAAFRIGDDTLRALGWDTPTPVLAPANTLVLANTRGFHCRATARAGTERASVYANLRPAAFGLRPR